MAFGYAGLWVIIVVYGVVLSSFVSSLAILAIEMSLKPPQILLDLWRAQGERLRRFIEPIDVLWKHKVERPNRVVGRWCSRSAALTKPSIWGHRFATSLHRTMKRQGKHIATGLHLCLKVVFLYTRFGSPFALLFFVVWSEWFMWTNDPAGETFRHIGQWGALVAVMVGIAAGTGRLTSTASGFKSSSPRLPDAPLVICMPLLYLLILKP